MQRTLSCLCVVLLALIGGVGCNSGSAGKTTPAKADSQDSHPEEGPHHGALLELGDEEYHAEIVHDEDAKTVTVYILDSTAKKAVPIDAKSLTIVVRADGKTNPYELKASAMEGEADGKSSRFVSSDKAIDMAIDTEGAESQLQVTIQGTPYTVKIAEHDHDEHDHDDEKK